MDVGCLDTLGLLQVRDMHFLPGALKAGEEHLRRCGAPGEPHPVETPASPGAPSSSGVPIASRQVVDGWIENVSDVLKVGDVLSLRIKSIDRENRRIRLTTVPPTEAEADSPRRPVEAFWVGLSALFFSLSCLAIAATALLQAVRGRP